MPKFSLIELVLIRLAKNMVLSRERKPDTIIAFIEISAILLFSLRS